MFGARGIPSTYSGYETFLTVLLPELAARGHRVTMYCRPGQGGEGSYKGVDRVVLSAVRSKQLDTLSHGLVAALRCRRVHHDAILVVNLANALFCLLLRLSGERVVLNTDGQEWLRGKWGRAARAYFLFSAHIAKFSASALVSDCVAMKRIYRDQFGANSTVIPYCWTGIDAEQRPEVLRALGLQPRRYFLVASRLNPENNVDRVVDAYLRSGSELPLVVLGVANYASPVQRRIEEAAGENHNLKLLGHVHDRATFATLVREAAAYVHAHSVGGMNPSLVEAMGCGARVLALATVFNRETLDDAGLYFSNFAGELPELLSSIGREEDGHSVELRDRARQRAQERFARSVVVRAYEELLLEVAGQGAS